MSNGHRFGLTAVLWGASWTLMVLGTAFVEIRLLMWGIFVALGACVATGWWIVEHVVRRERLEAEHLVVLAAAAIRDEDDDSGRLHSL